MTELSGESSRARRRVVGRRVVESRRVVDLRPGDLVQHYSTWEQTYGDPVRREVVEVASRGENRCVVTWRIPDSESIPHGTRDDYTSRAKPDATVDVIVGLPTLDDVRKPVTAAWIEAWTSGFNACRDGVPHDDAEAFMSAMQEAFDRSGSEMARKVNEGAITADEAREAMQRG